MSPFVRATGGLLQLKPSPVTEKDISKALEFASRLGLRPLRQKKSALKRGRGSEAEQQRLGRAFQVVGQHASFQCGIVGCEERHVATRASCPGFFVGAEGTRLARRLLSQRRARPPARSSVTRIGAEASRSDQRSFLLRGTCLPILKCTPSPNMAATGPSTKPANDTADRT